MRAKTSRATVALASSNDIVGSRPITGPISSGGASANGRWVKPARRTAAAYDAGAATATSWPASAHARSERHERPEVAVVGGGRGEHAHGPRLAPTGRSGNGLG